MNHEEIKSVIFDADDYKEAMEGRKKWAAIPAENFVRMYRGAGLEDKVTKDSRALDFGIGDGRNAKFMRDDGYEIWGTDVSDVALAAAQLRLKEYDRVHVVKVGNPRDIIGLNQKFDIIVAWEVLHWLGTAELVREAFDAFAKTIKPGGHLILTMPTEEYFLRRDSKSLGNDTYLSHAEARFDCQYYAPALPKLREMAAEFFSPEDVMVYRYEHGREGWAATLDNRFSMYGFLIKTRS